MSGSHSVTLALGLCQQADYGQEAKRVIKRPIYHSTTKKAQYHNQSYYITVVVSDEY